eukprot:11416245-Alexandrium_andersonii.AAC.1
MAKSWSSGWLKSQELPPNPARAPNAPAGNAPKFRLRAAAAAVARDGEKTSAADALTSPGAAPAAKSAPA